MYQPHRETLRVGPEAEEGVFVRKLARAIVLSAIQALLSSSDRDAEVTGLSDRAMSQEWIFGPDLLGSFATWCNLAGLSADAVRRRARELMEAGAGVKFCFKPRKDVWQYWNTKWRNIACNTPTQTQKQGLWMRIFIDVFMVVVVLCAGGIVGAALLGAIPRSWRVPASLLVTLSAQWAAVENRRSGAPTVPSLLT